jgi:hypothetical protein
MGRLASGISDAGRDRVNQPQQHRVDFPAHEERHDFQSRLESVSWQKCLINAEDCLIRAEREPARREQLLAEAEYWDLRARRQL